MSKSFLQQMLQICYHHNMYGHYDWSLERDVESEDNYDVISVYNITDEDIIS